MSYQELVKNVTPKENRWKNAIMAFLVGGMIGFISEIIISVFSPEINSIIWIIIAALLTGFGVFDSIVDKCRMGVIIPITGFAHSMTSASLEYKKEGLITGIGANCFKLAGSVILYGIVSAAILAGLRGLLWLL